MIKVSLLLSVLALLVACSSTSDKTTPEASQNAENVSAKPKTTAEVLNAIMTANTEEMNLSKMGAEKANNAKVKAFAVEMFKAHKKNNEKALYLAKEMNKVPETSPTITIFKFVTEDRIEELRKLSGKKFDEAFMETQVNVHEQILNKIEETLIPNTKEEKLEELLKITKDHAKTHLKEAKKIKKMI